MPTLDGHVHLIGEDADEYVATLLRAMDRNGVARAVVFGVQGDPNCPDALALSAHRRWPDRFVPFTCTFDSATPGMAEALDRRLSSGPWQGIGEVFAAADSASGTYRLRNGDERQHRYPVPPGGPRDPGFAGLFEVAAARHLPVLVHCDDAAALELLLSGHPRTTIIWAHADWFADYAPRLLGAYPNLFCEVGAWLHFGALEEPEAPWVADWAAAWPPLLEEFAGRITFGSDRYEWRHLEPPRNADAAYAAAARAGALLSSRARGEWLGGALTKVLGSPPSL
jgi:hypothetical protein